MNSENGEEKIEKDVSDIFWNTIETKTGANIPSYIRNILNVNGFNNPMSISLLDDEDLNEMEKSIQTERVKILNSKNQKAVFGPFDGHKDFYFLRGYRKALLSISKFIRDKGPENVLCTADPQSNSLQTSLKNRFMSGKGTSKETVLMSLPLL